MSSETEDDDGEHQQPRCRREKVKKTLLRFADRQSSRSKLHYKGVKSYLHGFYEYAKDPDAAGRRESEFLVKSRRIRVRSIWWRVILATGLMLMALGLTAALLSFILPQKLVIVEEDEELAVVDKDAASFNRNLEYLKLTGLATFCLGGVMSSAALMLASCCFRRCNVLASSSNENSLSGEPEKVAKKLVEDGERLMDGSEGVLVPPLSPLEVKVPGREHVFGVQPAAGDGEEVSGQAYPVPVINTTTVLWKQRIISTRFFSRLESLGCIFMCLFSRQRFVPKSKWRIYVFIHFFYAQWVTPEKRIIPLGGY